MVKGIKSLDKLQRVIPPLKVLVFLYILFSSHFLKSNTTFDTFSPYFKRRDFRTKTNNCVHWIHSVDFRQNSSKYLSDSIFVVLALQTLFKILEGHEYMLTLNAFGPLDFTDTLFLSIITLILRWLVLPKKR